MSITTVQLLNLHRNYKELNRKLSSHNQYTIREYHHYLYLPIYINTYLYHQNTSNYAFYHLYIQYKHLAIFVHECFRIQILLIYLHLYLSVDSKLLNYRFPHMHRYNCHAMKEHPFYELYLLYLPAFRWQHNKTN